MTATLLWKEYRQQRLIWLALVIFSMLMLACLALLFERGKGWKVFHDDEIRDGFNIAVLCVVVVFFQMFSLLFACPAFGQQTLGGLTGVITDTQGGILSGVTATIVGEQTGLTRSQVSGAISRTGWPLDSIINWMRAARTNSFIRLNASRAVTPTVVTP